MAVDYSFQKDRSSMLFSPQKKSRTLLKVGLFLSTMLSLFVISVVMQRYYKWKGLDHIRQLAQEVEWMKTKAILEKKIYRLNVWESEGIGFNIEEVASCHQPEEGKIIRSKRLIRSEHWTWLTLSRSSNISFSQSFCYHPLTGTFPDLTQGIKKLAIGLIPKEDFEIGQWDRVSILYIDGKNAQVSFE